MTGSFDFTRLKDDCFEQIPILRPGFEAGIVISDAELPRG